MCIHNICFYRELKKIILYHQVPTISVLVMMSNIYIILRPWETFKPGFSFMTSEAFAKRIFP